MNRDPKTTWREQWRSKDNMEGTVETKDNMEGTVETKDNME